jgi:hypothetical protein
MRKVASLPLSHAFAASDLVPSGHCKFPIVCPVILGQVQNAINGSDNHVDFSKHHALIHRDFCSIEAPCFAFPSSR